MELEAIEALELGAFRGLNESPTDHEKLMWKTVKKLKPIILEYLKTLALMSTKDVSEFALMFKYVEVLVFLGNPLNSDLTLMDVEEQCEELLPRLLRITSLHEMGKHSKRNKMLADLLKQAEVMCVYGEKLLSMPFEAALKEADRYHEYWNELMGNKMKISQPFPEEISQFLADTEPYKSIMDGFVGASPCEQGRIWQQFLVGVLVSLLVASQFVQLANVHKMDEKKKLEQKAITGWWSWWFW